MGEWPEGISDGSSLPCAECDGEVKFDFQVRDDLCSPVVPEYDKLNVLCMPCYDRIATEKGIDWAGGLKEVQFTGIGKTIGMVPVFIHKYTALTEAAE